MSGGTIHERLAAVMADVPAIPKTQRNQQQGYSFRGIDDLYQVFHSLFASHGVVILPEVLEADYVQQPHGRKGTLATDARLRIRYTFTAPDGSSVSIVTQGESRDYADKATNQAASAALKYGLLQMFLVPLAPDADAQSPEVQVPVEDDATVVAAKKTVLALAGGDREAAAGFWDEHAHLDPAEIIRLAKDHYDGGGS